MPSLFVIQGRDRGARYDLDGPTGVVSIGREAGNTVQIDDHEVSRRHAEIRRGGSGYLLTDLGSSNGTFVRLGGTTTVKHGEHVRMGDQLFRIELRR